MSEATKGKHCNDSCCDYYCPQNVSGRCQAPNKCLGVEEAAELMAELEAAKREIAALRKRERGDCAAMREALKHIKDRLPHMLQYMRVHWEDASAGGFFDELMLVIDAALSAPPRNCDLPEVAKDPWRAWLDDKSNWDEDGNPELEIHDWLFAPATEKEGGAK